MESATRTGRLYRVECSNNIAQTNTIINAFCARLRTAIVSYCFWSRCWCFYCR